MTMSESTVKSERPASRRRWWLWLGGGLGVLMLLVVIAFFVVTSASFLKSVVLPRVSSQIGAEVSVSDASISVFKEIILKGLKLQAANETPLLTAEEIKVRYSLPDLLRGNIHIPEITVTAPVIDFVQNPKGKSNLDALMEKLTQGTAQEPPAASTSSGSLRIHLQKLAVTRAILRATLQREQGKPDIAEIGPVNLTLENVRNGQTATLKLSTPMRWESNPPSPETNALVEATLDGDFTLALTAAAEPASIHGTNRLGVSRAAGSLAQMAGLVSELVCDITPTEVKQAALNLRQGTVSLAQLRAYGPFDMAKCEGRLAVELAGVDRKALNLAGAAVGLDFGPTTIGSTNTVQISKAGAQIETAGRLDVNRLQVTLTNLTTPMLELHSDYRLTVDTTSSNALIQTFNLAGTQDARPFLQGSLSSPMSIAWGATASQAGDANYNLVVTNFDFAPWKSFFGDALSAGSLNSRLQIASHKSGKQLVLDLAAQFRDLVSGTGTDAFRLETLDVTGRVQADDFTQYSGNLVATNLLTSQGSTRYPSLAGALAFDLWYQTNILDVRQCQLALTPTTRATNQMALKGRIDMSGSETFTGDLQLTAAALDFTSYYDVYESQAAIVTTTPTAGSANAPAPETEFEPMTMPLSQFTIRANVGAMYLREIEMTNLVATAVLDGGKVVVKPAQVGLNGAPVTATANLDLSVPGWAYDLNLNTVHTPLAPIVNSFTPDYRGQISGTLTADAAIKGVGITGTNLQKNLASKFYIGTTNLNLALNNVRSPILKSIIRVIAIYPDLRKNPASVLTSLGSGLLGGSTSSITGSWSDELSQSPIDVIELQGTVASGQADLSRAIIQSPAFQVQSQGTVQLASVLDNSALEFPLTITIRRTLASKINFVPEGAPTNATYVALPNYVTVRGTMGSPKTDINKTAVLGTALEQLGSKIPGVDTKTGNLIQGLGGLLTGRKPTTSGTNAPSTSTATNAPAPTSPATNATPVGSLLNLLKKKP